MILKNKRDQDAWLREKTLKSLKTNNFLQENDIVQVAETDKFYKIVSEVTDIPLQNNLYAKSITNGSDKLSTPRNISLSGDVTGNADFDGSKDIVISATILDDSHIHSNATISSLDASKITSGIISIDRLPKGALERCVVVTDDTARFKLTTSQVQQGDTVKVTATNKMYFVIDTSKLSTEAGYTVYTAGTATEVPWSGVTGKPSTMPNPQALTISLNGTSQGAYNGSAAKNINITPASIGAQVAGNYSTSGHTHDERYYTETEVNNLLAGKAASSHGNHVPATQSANNKVFLRNDNTWATVTPANIGAQPAGSYAASSHTHDERYYTESEVNSLLNGKANSSHGTHVPTPQSANNKVFLRNDNTWQTITPANIGAQVAGSYAASSHTHAYLPLSGGTMTGNIVGQSANTISGFGKIYNAVWNDYAEFFERGEQTEVGDIIALDENSDEERYIKATNESKVIVGVHSDTFAHLIGGENPMNGEDFYEYNIKKFIPVGLAGRVKVKVIGPVKKGDHIIVSDIAGVGASMQQHVDKYGFWAGEACIGRSLEDKNTEDIGLIKILI